jgi:glucose/arabinose dehydrogenase
VQPLEERHLLSLSLPAGFVDTPLVSGLSSPTAMVVAPDGRIFISEQHGPIMVVKNGQLLSRPFTTISDLDSAAERGLLGIELDPNFESNGYVYIYYTSNDGPVHNRVARLTARGDQMVPGSQVNLLDLPPINDAIYHMGGALHFGPDGDLYIGVGDHLWYDGSQLQTLTIPFGKILRIKPDGTIPTDNPWYNTASGVNRAAWAMGLRNPFTFSIQPRTGRMFIDDVGQETWEEIDDGKAGANYGWPVSEGPENTAGFTAPIYYYKHDPGCAIIGGPFYNPPSAQFPGQYIGDYFFADLCDGQLSTLDPAHGNRVSVFATGLQTPVDFDLAPDGSMYYLQRGADTNHDIEQGSIGRISFANPTTGPQPPVILAQPQSVKAPQGRPNHSGRDSFQLHDCVGEGVGCGDFSRAGAQQRRAGNQRGSLAHSRREAGRAQRTHRLAGQGFDLPRRTDDQLQRPRLRRQRTISWTQRVHVGIASC